MKSVHNFCSTNSMKAIFRRWSKIWTKHLSSEEPRDFCLILRRSSQVHQSKSAEITEWLSVLRDQYQILIPVKTLQSSSPLYHLKQLHFPLQLSSGIQTNVTEASKIRLYHLLTVTASSYSVRHIISNTVCNDILRADTVCSDSLQLTRYLETIYSWHGLLC